MGTVMGHAVAAMRCRRRSGAARVRGRFLASAALGALVGLSAPALGQGITSGPLPPVEVGSGARPASAGGMSASEATLRMDRLEAQVRSLTGQVEQYEHRIRQLEDQLRRFQEDVEFRFRDGGAPRPAAATGAGTGSVRAEQRYEPPPALPGRGQPPTYGGTQPLRAPDQPAPAPLAPAAEPLNINPAARFEPSPSPAGPAVPFRPGGNPAEVALAVPQDPQTSYDVAYAFVLQRDYEAATSAFADFLARYPDDKLAGNAQYWLGESHYAQGDYRSAADAFLTGYRKYPTGGKGPDSLLKLGMSLAALGEKRAACASFAEFSNKFPGASEAMKNRVRAERRGAGC